MASQKGLGRGLGALLGDFSDEPGEESAYKLLPLHRVEPNPEQPRQDFDEEELGALADSIRIHGVLQPLTVRETGEGYYQIIAGERRWRASRMAGLTEVPAIVVEADDKKAKELALIENLQRQDLNSVEEALGYQSLMNDFGLTQEETAEPGRKGAGDAAHRLHHRRPCKGNFNAEIRQKAAGGRPENCKSRPLRPSGGAAVQKYVPGAEAGKGSSRLPGGLRQGVRKEPEQALRPGREDRQRQAQGSLRAGILRSGRSAEPAGCIDENSEKMI